jgi:hypothetical protein
VVFSFEVGQTSFFHNIIVDFRLKRFGIMVFFPILFYIQILKIYFQKIGKLLDVYILKKLISPFFVEFFFLFAAKNNDQTTNCIKGVTPYCKFKLRRITCFGPPYAKWSQYGLLLV